jgi:pilus assembly protein Flp/PilA
MTRYSLDRLVGKLRNQEEGVTALEYALIAALIAVVIIAGVKLVGTQASTTFDKVGQEMKTANN